MHILRFFRACEVPSHNYHVMVTTYFLFFLFTTSGLTADGLRSPLRKPRVTLPPLYSLLCIQYYNSQERRYTRSSLIRVRDRGALQNMHGYFYNALFYGVRERKKWCRKKKRGKKT